MTNLTMGSLFDGSGGFPLGGLLNGITPLWASEIEPFPIRVTTKRLPFLKHYGDINFIDGTKIEPVDIITFGSPCTNLSVAGRREGLDGRQSSLFYQAIRVIKEMRAATDGKYPRFIVWENVPGAYSSAGGRDFQQVLTEILQVKQETAIVSMPEKGKWLPAGEVVADGFSIAWRTLDAQYWGVAQRRRRCYLVADFASERAGDILFKFEGMSGYTPQVDQTRQRTAGDAEAGVGDPSRTILNDQGGSNMSVSEDVTGTLRAQEHGHQPLVFEPGAASRLGGHAWENVAGALRADMGDNQLAVAIKNETDTETNKVAGFIGGQGTKAGSIGYRENLSPTIKSEAGGNSIPCILTPEHPVTALENHPADSRIKLDESGTIQTLTGRMGTGGGNVPLIMDERALSQSIRDDVASALIATDYKGAQCVFEPTPKTLKMRAGCEGGGKGALIQENQSATLSCNNDQTVFVPFTKGTRPHDKDEGQKWEQTETANTLNTFDTGEGRCNELCVRAYGISSDQSNAMLSDNPYSGIYEADTSRTLDRSGGNPSCNQGGIAVVEGCAAQRNGENKKHPSPDANESLIMAYDCRNHYASGISATLQAKNNGGQSLNYINPIFETYQSTTGPLMANSHPGSYSGQDAYQDMFITMPYRVRRLTPAECALLQGFPSDWCAGLGTPDPSEEDTAWWQDVFETHRKAMGTSSKPKSRKQVVKWLNDPHTDSAEYKMWGNGVALPCVCFVMAGIVWAANT